jgi:hypothetical protein
MPGGARHRVIGPRGRDGRSCPVLRDHDSAPVHGGVGSEEARRRVGVELFPHGAHRFGDRKPFSDREQAVDANADEEHHKGAIDRGGVAAGEWIGHIVKRYNWFP